MRKKIDSLKENIVIYQWAMEEIKRRVAVIDAALVNEFRMPNPPRADLCYVQLRKICELIALSCLVIHDNLKNAQAQLRNAYEADKIVKVLFNQQTDFYPRPVQGNRDAVTGRTELSLKNKQVLTLDDLKKLWRESGKHLHIGNLKDILAPKPPPIDFERIQHSRNLIVELLSHHWIKTNDIHVALETLIDFSPGGRVMCSIMGAIEQASKDPRLHKEFGLETRLVVRTVSVPPFDEKT